MSVHEIIAELPKLSEDERELILRWLVNLGEPFEPTPAMEDAIQEGLRSVREEKTYSAAEVRARIAAWRPQFLSSAANISADPLAFAGVAAAGHVPLRSAYVKLPANGNVTVTR